MNRRQLLGGAACGTISANVAAVSETSRKPCKMTRARAPTAMRRHCWHISPKRAIVDGGTRNALFVFGACERAIAEIDFLDLPLTGITILSDSLAGPGYEEHASELYGMRAGRLNNLSSPLESVKRSMRENDRVVLLGNFSAPFASQILVSLATMARDMGRPVIAIGGTPAPGVQGEIRTQRGWTCIEELRRIGCCVTTVPEVDFYSAQLDKAAPITASTQPSVDEGSPYCRALELALNQVDFGVASIGEDVLTSKFSAGNFVSLGWGYSASGDDAATAANMALANGYGLSEGSNRDITTQVLVTSNDDEILAQLRTSTEAVSDAIGTSAPIYFGASHSARVTNNALQVTVFR